MLRTPFPVRPLLAAAALASAFAVQAEPVLISGFDVDANGTVPAGGNSVAARNSLLSKMVAGSVVSEGFEGATVGNTPSSIFGGAATFEQNIGTGRVENNPGDAEFFGRFNTTPGGANWWQTNGTFTITFAQAVSAFGFYGTDFADFGGLLSLALLDANGDLVNELVPSLPTETANGSLAFLGFYDQQQSYSGIRFTIGQFDIDLDTLGFDDMFYGALATTPPGDVPEPGSLALVAASLFGLAAARRRSRRG